MKEGRVGRIGRVGREGREARGTTRTTGTAGTTSTAGSTSALLETSNIDNSALIPPTEALDTSLGSSLKPTSTRYQ